MLLQFLTKKRWPATQNQQVTAQNRPKCAYAAGTQVFAKAHIDEAELRKLYEEEKDRLVTAEKILVEDVFFRGMDEPARGKAQETLEKLKGLPDGDPWQLVLDGSFAVRRLTVEKGRNPEIHAAAKHLAIGEVSGVIEDKDGLHVIKLKSKEEGATMTFEQARPYLEQRLLAGARQERKKQWEKELREKALIELF